MQIDQVVQTADLWLRGGNIGALVAVFWIGFKVNTKLNRDESVKRDYPPHRHINGKVIYPDDYPPSRVDNLS